ncbi:hypothetical protein [Halomonas koreensis]|uniref:Uncharacterized protein n=1 Tax=Halomonas koreensis TaxID=245385 RepID=A0ABU1G1D7_9GAMM|nr:hypothetical protein [Halomonas koreensis]MDR5866744.1 hypothetical protein [Halomonas koreensis]
MTAAMPGAAMGRERTRTASMYQDGAHDSAAGDALRDRRRHLRRGRFEALAAPVVKAMAPALERLAGRPTPEARPLVRRRLG